MKVVKKGIVTPVFDWYLKVSFKQAVRLGISRYNSDRACVKCKNTIRFKGGNKCAKCNSRGIRRKDRACEIARYSNEVSNVEKYKKTRSIKSATTNARLQSFIRGSLSRIIHNYKGDGYKGEYECGYTIGHLREHLQSLFVKGMSWDNKAEWHIDHIKPVSLFIEEGITDPAIINALSNLQPLWAKDNLSKGAKY
tara:strand:+ start:241 stop:825 length:585 start_codon:yes stop_codon:yes gene_type:complete